MNHDQILNDEQKDKLAGNGIIIIFIGEENYIWG